MEYYNAAAEGLTALREFQKKHPRLKGNKDLQAVEKVLTELDADHRIQVNNWNQTGGSYD